MTIAFRPAASFTEQHGLFIALVGGTNSGKTFSAMRLARGLAGGKRVAVLDTEGGRTLHLRQHFDFDAQVMDPPFRPKAFSDAAAAAEDAGYGALLIDSFSQEWAGLGGVLSWQEDELQRMAGDDYKARERMKMAAWIKPKTAHKAMVNALLQRRLPIIFAIRGEQTVKPGEAGQKPTNVFKAITNKDFLFEVTVSFRLAADKKGIIDLSDPAAWKMEGAHRDIFRDGEQLSEEHGAKLLAWARGGASAPPATAPFFSVSKAAVIQVAADVWLRSAQRAFAELSDDPHALAMWWNSMVQDCDAARLALPGDWAEAEKAVSARLDELAARQGAA